MNWLQFLFFPIVFFLRSCIWLIALPFKLFHATVRELLFVRCRKCHKLCLKHNAIKVHVVRNAGEAVGYDGPKLSVSVHYCSDACKRGAAANKKTKKEGGAFVRRAPVMPDFHGN